MKYHYPNKQGMFGQYGGRFVPPELESRLREVEDKYLSLRHDSSFKHSFHQELKNFANRPSPLYLSRNFIHRPDVRVYLKREDLNHTGAHKINNTIGQVLVAKALGKKILIAETGAGQHGVATATVAARYGMKCQIYMGERDITNQKMNVNRMKLLGADVIPVSQGQGTLKDAVDAALIAYSQNNDAYYLLGSVVGPHPYPLMVRDFQRVIGKETKGQILTLEGRLPDYIIACVGGGSNAMGIFYPFIKLETVNLIAVEPAGLGESSNRHGLSLLKGKAGLIHGFKCLVIQNTDGDVSESYSAASGLDYPGVGPELSLLKDMNRLDVVGITDDEAIQALIDLSRSEGIIPALESAHALAYAQKLSQDVKPGTIIVVNLSGRGDKDVETVANSRYNTESNN